MVKFYKLVPSFSRMSVEPMRLNKFMKLLEHSLQKHLYKLHKHMIPHTGQDLEATRQYHTRAITVLIKTVSVSCRSCDQSLCYVVVALEVVIIPCSSTAFHPYTLSQPGAKLFNQSLEVNSLHLVKCFAFLSTRSPRRAEDPEGVSWAEENIDSMAAPAPIARGSHGEEDTGVRNSRAFLFCVCFSALSLSSLFTRPCCASTRLEQAHPENT